MQILLLDNHDSFTYNLAELLRRHHKGSFKILSPEGIVIEDVDKFDGIIFSPGPGRPDEHPMMIDILRKYESRKPILGICLGMQTMAIHYGAAMKNLKQVVHGQPRKLIFTGHPHAIFKDIPHETTVGLYHSWAIESRNLPPALEVLALSPDGIIMAITHKKFNVCGVQFHPESIMTPLGWKMVVNWLETNI